ncbi:VWA containing CoxE family protein [Sulfobacillus acidophilus TPY]|nr:VWA containing CoxE family protein [Sulfobacillus acidophilus TPY]
MTRLADTGYVADQKVAAMVYLAEKLGRPLLVEGPAGVGKTRWRGRLPTPYHPDYGSWTQRLFIRWQTVGFSQNPPTGFRIDWPRTIRLGFRHAGEVVRFEHAHLRPRLPSVLWVIDVSGSMRTYTPFFLGLAWHLARVGTPVHALLSATESLWVTPLLRRWRPGQGPWAHPGVLGGGTRLGQALERVVRDFGSHIDGSTIVVIVSDGFDTGKLDILHRHLAWIRQRARIIWMNPLLSVPGYIPQSQALQVALPLVTEHVGIWGTIRRGFDIVKANLIDEVRCLFIFYCHIIIGH